MTHLLALPNGTVLAGDFRIEQVLGAGGFGITYLAEDLALQRKVAIKEFFPGEFATRDSASLVRHRSGANTEDYVWGLERFIEEAQTLARFDHPNIVHVNRYFRANNTAYMVLKFEEGESFRQWLDRNQRPASQAELDAMIVPILDALELIHAHDFLHRDIAADNILIRLDGSPVLIDFGSARGEIANQTKTLSALVKPGYSPFEQYAANGKQQGPWTDIYALAATLYFGMTGTRPPDAPSRLTADEFVPASKAALGRYRPTFLAAIDRALELQISTRPQSIAEWRQALLHAPAPQPGAAVAAAPPPPIGTIKDTRKIETDAVPNLAWKKKPAPPPEPHRVAAIAEGLAQAVATPGHKMMAGGRAQAKRALDGGRAGAERAKSVLANAAERGRALAANVHRVRLPRPNWSLPKLDLANKLNPKRIARRNSPTKIRHRSLIEALNTELAKPIENPDEVAKDKAEDKPPRKKLAHYLKVPGSWRSWFQRAPKEYKPQSERPSVTRKRGPVGKLLWGTSMALRLAVILAFVSFLVLSRSPDGTVVATSATKPASQTPATFSRLGLVKTIRGHTSAITSLAVSDDGTRIASTSNDGSSMVWNASTGDQIRELKPGPARINAIDIAGDQMVMAQDNGQLSLWNVKTGKRARTYKRHGGTVHAAVFAPEPSRFYSAGDDTRLRVWNARRGSWRSLRGHKGAVTALAATADGKMLVSGGADKTVKVWDARRGKVRKTLHAHEKAVTAVAVAPNGTVLASGSEDHSIRIYAVKGHDEIKTLYGHGSTITALAFSPSGELLASASADHAVKLWNAKTGALIYTFVGHTDAVNDLAFMPDGRRLVTASADKTLRIWTAQVAGIN